MEKKLLILKLDGDFHTGFEVEWEMGTDGERPESNGKLKRGLVPVTDLVEVYREWQDTYYHPYVRRIKQTEDQKKMPAQIQITDLRADLKQHADRLTEILNQWFDDSSLGTKIKDLLTTPEDEYRVVICTENSQARSIPWFLWQGWQAYPHLEISLGAPYTQRHNRIYQKQVRILVILGNDRGIDIETDRKILSKYNQNKRTDLEFLVQPTIDKLRQKLSDKQGWHIISFSGHSHTEGDNQGRIFINDGDSLTMDELEAELKTAIEKGLQLAIFNSCDGLGIAAQLESLHIPQVIVMRHPVPDIVAHNFLKYFLAEFTGGKSLYQSVSKARDNLRTLEDDYPYASWLPVIIQNRLEVPPTWRSLVERTTDNRVWQQRITIGSIVSSIAIISIFAMTFQRQLAISTIKSSNENAISFSNDGNIEAALEKSKKAVTEIKPYYFIGSDVTMPAIATFSEIISNFVPHTTLPTRKVSAIESVMYGKDGQTIISVDRDKDVNLYKNNKIIDTLSGEMAIVHPNGEKIFTVDSSSNSIKIWQRDRQTEKWSSKYLPDTKGEISAIALSPDGKDLAIALNNKGVKLYNIDDTKQSTILPVSGYINTLKFTPDGQKIITGGSDGSIQIWTRSGEKLKTLLTSKEKNNNILAIAVSPDGNKIAASDEIGNIKIWNIEGKLLGEEKQKVFTLDFSPDSQWLATGGESKEIKIWTFADNSLKEIKTLSGHTDEIKSLGFNPNNPQELISGSKDGTIKSWQINIDKTQPYEAKSFNYSPDGQLLALGTDKGNVNIIDPQTQKNIDSFNTGYNEWITQISISADSQYIATRSKENTSIRLWKSDGTQIKTRQPITGTFLSFSPSEPILATITDKKVNITDKKVNIYDLNGQLQKSWDTKQADITHLSFTPDGSNIITGDSGGVVTLWPLKGGKLKSFSTDKGSILDVSCSPDRTLIAIATEKKATTLWSFEGEELHPSSNLSLSNKNITTLTFSRDSQVLITGNKEAEIQFWNRQGELLNTIPLKSIKNEIFKIRLGANDREITAIDEPNFDGSSKLLFQLNLDPDKLLEAKKPTK